MKCLLEQDPNLNVTDHFENTAVICAAEKGYKEIVQMLLEKGADASIANRMGYTAAMFNF